MEKTNNPEKTPEALRESSLYHPLKIGSLEIPGNLLMAPLAGYTDRAFRSLALEQGANLCFTEMVSCEAVARGNKKTIPLMKRAIGEKFLAIQLFTGTLDSMERSLKRVLAFEPDLLDLNCGCPVPKVTKTGAGSALMKNPDLIYKLVQTMKTTGKPVSVKIRSGWDHPSINYIEAALAAQEGGADMISLHARTRSQGYSGKADWAQLADLKQRMNLPVLGSGDLFSPEDGLIMLQETGIDGLLFARGALGNPFIFKQCRELLLNLPSSVEPNLKTRIATAREHFRRSLQYEGEEKTCKEIRKHLCYYTKGLPSGKELRNQLIHCKTATEYENCFDQYLAGGK